MELKAGDKLGRYQLVPPIGEGGMGEVWKAPDTQFGRDVALKVSKAAFTARFEQEARAIAAFNHPNICQIYDVGPNYLVMELIGGLHTPGSETCEHPGCETRHQGARLRSGEAQRGDAGRE